MSSTIIVACILGVLFSGWVILLFYSAINPKIYLIITPTNDLHIYQIRSICLSKAEVLRNLSGAKDQWMEYSKQTKIYVEMFVDKTQCPSIQMANFVDLTGSNIKPKYKDGIIETEKTFDPHAH